MRMSRVKTKLAQNKPVLMTSIDLTEQTAELASILGFDCVWIDMEHQASDLVRVSSFLRAVRVGTSDAVVRVPRGGFNLISRVLEAGAQGVIYPHCESAEEAHHAVRWAKFAPLGSRPTFGLNVDGVFGLVSLMDYVATANESVFVGILIETPDGLANVDAIAAVPGVDFLYFGRADYAVTAGLKDHRTDPQVADAFARIAQAASDAGIHWGGAASSAEDAKRLVEAGARVITHGRDAVWVRDAMTRTLSDFARHGFERADQTH
jgi:4-hydroxy-2-oxoheptanedioate aldolase